MSGWRSMAWPVIGAVGLPGLPVKCCAPIKPGKWSRQRPQGCAWSSAARGPAREAVAEAAQKLDAELVPMGSAPERRRWPIARGDADIYLHSGGQYEWDSCAPVAVALAHGLHCLAHRWQPAGLQPGRCLHARSADLPEGTRGAMVLAEIAALGEG
jgi:3'-phosphoadenosine 5'-phosphosulfate (PAPS) 3'-phosphatase